MSALDHQPNRPFWDCRCCGRDWPCELARQRMIDESTSGLHLAMAAWSYFEDYARDTGSGPFPEAFARFISWAHRS
jgi:hypothetical protein